MSPPFLFSATSARGRAQWAQWASGEGSGGEAEFVLDRVGDEAPAGGGVAVMHQGLRVEAVDHAEELPRDGVRVVGGELAGVAPRDENVGDQGFPGVHLGAHRRREDLAAPAEAPRVDPDQGEVVAAAVLQRVDES